MARFERKLILELTDDDLALLNRVSNSVSEEVRCVKRAQLLLAYCEGLSRNALQERLGVSYSMVHDTVDKAIRLGVASALHDAPRSGKPAEITAEARAWIVDLACTKPTDHGYPHELWSIRLLAAHARKHCAPSGHPCLAKVAGSTVHTILGERSVKPHKIRYYLENRDPDFAEKMAQVLYVYKQVEMYHTAGMPDDVCAVVSYDEKPGVQAIANTAPDLPPVPGKHATVSRDHEYVRHGTVTLLAALDLMDGSVTGIVRDRHRSAEFIELLDTLDKKYPIGARIRVVLDNHSAHRSQLVRDYLDKKQGRFEFVFTPKHGSWLNIIESFFAKMANSMLRGIRVKSKHELVERIEAFLAMVNAEPVTFRWRYRMDEVVL